MSYKSKISWTQSSWSPVVGCTKISEGCQNCYAEKMANRLAAENKKSKEELATAQQYAKKEYDKYLQGRAKGFEDGKRNADDLQGRLEKIIEAGKVCIEINDSGEEYTSPNADAAQALVNLFNLIEDGDRFGMERE